MINIHFGGFKPASRLGALQPIKTSTPVKLFVHLKDNCRYSTHDKKFISTEVKRLLAYDLIEPSHSPWQAQPFIITSENHPKRMVIDYSQNTNNFTQLDAYPLPLLQGVVKQVAQYKVYSTLDMSSAYHQIELPESDRIQKMIELTLRFKLTDHYGNGSEIHLVYLMRFQLFSESSMTSSKKMTAKVQ